MAKREVSIGQAYCPVGDTYMSRRAPRWKVSDIFMHGDGLRYARLVNLQDASLVKTISIEALTDNRLFALESA